ncbi:Ercc1-like DNA excision repair protein [Vairimorpha necatrix]|uniref:Ercc1-like DNA excision repair protein n=1 Tax=Vairimorpha necatrix TaxID=6039 RepID=A0AAX4JDJ0_9MICR
MIKINKKQYANNVISYLTDSSYSFIEDISTDYEINNTISVLFLSLRFHCTKPEYIYKRLNKLKPYKLSIVLLYVDSENFSSTLLELYDKLDATIILGFSNEECARYLKGLDINQNRSINVIRRKEESYETFLTSWPKINTTDSACILKNYHNLKDFFNNLEKDVKNISGIGNTKTSLLKKYYDMNFKEE